jgi:hypothetical protein
MLKRQPSEAGIYGQDVKHYTEVLDDEVVIRGSVQAEADEAMRGKALL